ncbi:hypothetical protein KEM09_15245 [Carboxylicivirga mesophila]|uniref:Uncharacterized protein n=1 Tax=Carboxylicivirga mesophila TaxID=1166478 RepID=A0ABS5KCK0_9BACT|nr:hypothetical protein [Carboxylicivirga mesophila]MBS2212774.1 hypothetical protein [Carboxylicivirga mesophila]
MFGLFKKRNRPIHELPISKALVEYRKKGFVILGINFYIDDQILFQVLLAKHFKEKGLEVINEDDMAIYHFFNKTKTLTNETWEIFKNEEINSSFLHFEELKGVFGYVRNIGKKPTEIEEAIYNDMKLYNLSKEKKVVIEYVG